MTVLVGRIVGAADDVTSDGIIYDSVMVVIDAVALLAILAARPWSALRTVGWRPWSLGYAPLSPRGSAWLV